MLEINNANATAAPLRAENPPSGKPALKSFCGATVLLYSSEAEVDEDDQHLLESEPVTPPLPDAQQATQQQTIAKKEIQTETISSQSDIGAREGKKGLATPAVRRLAMEHNVSLMIIL